MIRLITRTDLFGALVVAVVDCCFCCGYCLCALVVAIVACCLLLLLMFVGHHLLCAWCYQVAVVAVLLL